MILTAFYLLQIAFSLFVIGWVVVEELFRERQ